MYQGALTAAGASRGNEQAAERSLDGPVCRRIDGDACAAPVQASKSATTERFEDQGERRKIRWLYVSAMMRSPLVSNAIP